MNKKWILLLLLTNFLVAAVVLLLSPVLVESTPVVWLTEKLTGEHQLVPVTDETGDILYWTCSMHPSVRMSEPGQCPICGMDLIPVEESPAPSAASQDGMTSSGEVTPGSFVIDPSRQQMINVQTSLVETRPLEKTIRTVGVLELDEGRVFHVHTKVKGWIQEVFADFEHQHVMKGEPLFSLYSPELVATQEEYLLALRTSEELSASPFENVSGGARSLLQAARRRLELYDLTEEQIEELEKTGKPQKSLTIFSPVMGHVLERNAFQNLYVTPETMVYSIADHSRLWAQVEIYENEIPFVKVGQAVSMTTVAYPGEVFRGRIIFIYPHMDPETRTLRARLEFPNPGLRLKPEMYVNAEIQASLGRDVAVPASAVLRTGTRDLVFVDQGEGRMNLREVVLGVKAGDYYQVLSGLQAGEEVVTSGNFLVDAESKIRGVEAAWETPRPPAHQH